MEDAKATVLLLLLSMFQAKADGMSGLEVQSWRYSLVQLLAKHGAPHWWSDFRGVFMLAFLGKMYEISYYSC